MLCILSNTVVLSLESYKNKPSTNKILISVNRFFSYLFAVEMIIKIKGLGIKTYVRDGYNLFDGLLVVISIVEINIVMLVGNKSGANTI